MLVDFGNAGGEVDVGLAGGLLFAVDAGDAGAGCGLAGVMIGEFLFDFLVLGVDKGVLDAEDDGLRWLSFFAGGAFVGLPLSLGDEQVPERITSLALDASSAFANALVAWLENFIVN